MYACECRSRTIDKPSPQNPLLIFMRFAWTAGAIKEAAPIAPIAIPIVAVDLRESRELAGSRRGLVGSGSGCRTRGLEKVA